MSDALDNYFELNKERNTPYTPEQIKYGVIRNPTAWEENTNIDILKQSLTDTMIAVLAGRILGGSKVAPRGIQQSESPLENIKRPFDILPGTDKVYHGGEKYIGSSYSPIDKSKLKVSHLGIGSEGGFQTTSQQHIAKTMANKEGGSRGDGKAVSDFKLRDGKYFNANSPHGSENYKNMEEALLSHPDLVKYPITSKDFVNRSGKDALEQQWRNAGTKIGIQNNDISEYGTVGESSKRSLIDHFIKEGYVGWRGPLHGSGGLDSEIMTFKNPNYNVLQYDIPTIASKNYEIELKQSLMDALKKLK